MLYLASRLPAKFLYAEQAIIAIFVTNVWHTAFEAANMSSTATALKPSPSQIMRIAVRRCLGRPLRRVIPRLWACEKSIRMWEKE